jgi:hypothetical protein
LSKFVLHRALYEALRSDRKDYVLELSGVRIAARIAPDRAEISLSGEDSRISFLSDDGDPATLRVDSYHGTFNGMDSLISKAIVGLRDLPDPESGFQRSRKTGSAAAASLRPGPQKTAATGLAEPYP